MSSLEDSPCTHVQASAVLANPPSRDCSVLLIVMLYVIACDY